MRTYEERAGYILKQRDIRLAKRRRIRSAVTLSAASVCSLALIVGAGIAVNRMADRKGAIWISPGGASSGVSANPREPAFPTELIYNREKCATASNFTMPEFPGVDFKVDDNVVSANGKALYSGMPVSTVYLADLNGDGCRELCSDIAFGSGMIDERILVYDYANSELYELSDRVKYDYALALEDGVLKYKRYAYPVTSGDTPEEEGALTLSIMKRIEEEPEKNTAPEPEKVYDYWNDHPNSSDPFEFTMPEFPGVNFKVEEDGNIFANGKRLYGGMPTLTVYLADLNGDGRRELCSDIAIGSGRVDQRVWAYDYANSEMYRLSDRGRYDYILALENGILKYKRYAYPVKSYLGKDDAPEEEGALTLFVMERVSDGSKQIPPIEKLYPRDNSDAENIIGMNDDFEFTIPEVPESSFKLEKGVLSRDGESLFHGYPIHSIYITDLNEDGVREICGEYSVGEGVVDMNIFAYDPKAKELYTLSDTGNKEYVLTLENEMLIFTHYVHNGSERAWDEKGVLTLSRMNKLCGLPKADSQS